MKIENDVLRPLVAKVYQAAVALEHSDVVGSATRLADALGILRELAGEAREKGIPGLDVETADGNRIEPKVDPKSETRRIPKGGCA